MGQLERDLDDPAQLELRSRLLVERLALRLKDALLLRAARGFVAGAFCASCLSGQPGLAFGTLPAGTAFT